MEEVGCFGQYSAVGPWFLPFTLTHNTYPCIVADHVRPVMEKVLPDGCGLFQDNTPCHKAENG